MLDEGRGIDLIDMFALGIALRCVEDLIVEKNCVLERIYYSKQLVDVSDLILWNET
jgi:hypothetical protein